MTPINKLKKESQNPNRIHRVNTVQKIRKGNVFQKKIQVVQKKKK